MNNTEMRGQMLLREAARSGGKRGGGRSGRRYFRDRLGRFASRVGGAPGRWSKNPGLRAAGRELKADVPIALGQVAARAVGQGVGAYIGARQWGASRGTSAKVAAIGARRGAKIGGAINGFGLAVGAGRAFLTRKDSTTKAERDRSLKIGVPLMAGYGALSGYGDARTGKTQTNIANKIIANRSRAASGSRSAPRTRHAPRTRPGSARGAWKAPGVARSTAPKLLMGPKKRKK